MKRIVVCSAEAPFIPVGGAEMMTQGLVRALGERGFAVDYVGLPFTDDPRPNVLRSAAAWRMLNLDHVPGHGQPIDAAICLQYPSYVLRHPRKIVWLMHQHRSAYDLAGTPYSDFSDSPADRATMDMIRRVDTQTLGEAQAIYTISRTVADRLRRYNGLRATPLYQPPPRAERYHSGDYGDYVFVVSRQDPQKRIDLLIKAMPHTHSGIRAVIGGTGPMLAANKALAAEMGVADRVEFLGFVDDERLIDLYANALAVFYAPFDEDYGFVTLEGFLSRKAVVTARDSGGTLEFVRDGQTGFVFDAADPAGLARLLDDLMADKERARRMGEAGYRRVAGITWDAVVAALTEPIP
ncbi:MAG: glycosyltransferase family 4 protein [Anaerolineae bacterium]